MRISEFQVRTRNLPFVISILGVALSLAAIIISINKDKPNTEQSQQKETQLDSKQSEVQSIVSDERNELNKSDSNTDSLYILSLDTVKIDNTQLDTIKTKRDSIKVDVVKIDTVKKQKTHNTVYK